jgi:hypothetical protein
MPFLAERVGFELQNVEAGGDAAQLGIESTEMTPHVDGRVCAHR